MQRHGVVTGRLAVVAGVEADVPVHLAALATAPSDSLRQRHREQGQVQRSVERSVAREESARRGSVPRVSALSVESARKEWSAQRASARMSVQKGERTPRGTASAVRSATRRAPREPQAQREQNRDPCASTSASRVRERVRARVLLNCTLPSANLQRSSALLSKATRVLVVGT